MASLTVLVLCGTTTSCFKNDRDRYSAKYKETTRAMSFVGNKWEQVDKNGEGASLQAAQGFQQRDDLLEAVRAGFRWNELGVAIEPNEVAARIGVDPATITHDGWGGQLEYRVVGRFLAVRSPGHGQVFDGVEYKSGEYAWPSACDIVHVAVANITRPKDHWKYDDWLYQDDEYRRQLAEAPLWVDNPKCR